MRTGYVRDRPGFPASEQERILIDAGVPKERIWEEGRGAETLASCLRAMRSVTELEIARGLRPLGESDVETLANLDAIHAAGKVVLDPETGRRSGPGDGAVMLAVARSKRKGEATFGTRDNAARLGRRGGLARAAQILYAKNDRDQRVWMDARKFSRDEDAARAIGRSRSTLINAYGPSGRPKGRRPIKPHI